MTSRTSRCRAARPVAKLNSVYTEIKANPGRFGGKKGDEPFADLAGVVGNLVDLPIDHWATIDMDGFAGMIDALGGVDEYVADAICDPLYHQLGVHKEFEANAGWWHLTGPQALGLARVRHNVGGSDFKRVRRQMDLLVAIRDRIVEKGAQNDPLGWLGKIPTIHTDLSPATILAAGAWAARDPPGAVAEQRRVIEPGAGNGGVEMYDSRGYVLKAQMDEIRNVAGLLFTQPGSRPTTGRFKPPPDKPSTVKNLPRFKRLLSVRRAARPRREPLGGATTSSAGRSSNQSARCVTPSSAYARTSAAISSGVPRIA